MSLSKKVKKSRDDKSITAQQSEEDPQLQFVYWDTMDEMDENEANLMNFHVRSADMASFCGSLWKSSGRPSREYCEMDIEMGSSDYCHVPVIRLVMEALNCDLSFLYSTVFINMDCSSTPKMSSEQGSRLIDGLIRLNQSDALIIARHDDLFALNVISRYKALGFRRLPRTNNSYVWVSPEAFN